MEYQPTNLHFDVYDRPCIPADKIWIASRPSQFTHHSVYFQLVCSWKM